MGLYLSQNEPKLLGRITLFSFNPRNRSAELGYWLLDEYVGHGYMALALRALCTALLFNRPTLNKIYAQTAEFIARSIRLLESIGFHRNGVLREYHEKDDVLFADYIYSLTAKDSIIAL